MNVPRKLIEGALPLEAINKAAACARMPGIGPHARGLHGSVNSESAQFLICAKLQR